MRKFLIIISIQAIFISISWHAYGQKLRFQSFSEQEGLPPGSPLCFLQDRNGFLWIGTTDGLSRYDGKKFKEFYHIRNDSTSISNNFILNLTEDHSGNIWIGTRKGLNRFNPEKEQFDRFIRYGGKLFEAENIIHSVIEDKNGFIWYGTYNGLFRLDPKTQDWMQFLPQIENDHSITHQTIWKVFEDIKGKLWIGTGKGLTTYDNDDSFSFKQYLPEPENPNGLKTEQIFEFAEQPDGTMWLGTFEGLYKINQSKEDIQFQQFVNDPNDKNSLSHNMIESLITDGEDRLWAATWNGGLNEILVPTNNKNNLQFIHHRHDTRDPLSINVDFVKNVYRDRSGILWVGTSSQTQKLVPNSWKFNTVNHIPNDTTSLSNEIVKSTFKDSRGNFWVGTRDGLNFLAAEKFEKRQFEFTIFKHKANDPSSISHNNIFGLQEDDRGYFWIGTYRGLNFINLETFNPEKPAFQHFKTDHGLPSNWISDVLQISGNDYWIATYGQLSLMTFDPDHQENTSFLNFDMDDSREDALVNASTYEVAKDKFGDQWIGTFDGLSKFVSRNGRDFFENYKNVRRDSTSLSNNSIVTIHLDKKGRLWIGTRGGLNLAIQKDRNQRIKFKTFGKPEGFSNEVIQAIEEDKNSNLWIGTNNGLHVFNPEKALKGENGVIKTYDKNDGLAASGIVFRSSFMDSVGQMYFGSANGFSYFDPSFLPRNENIPAIIFTDLKVLNESVHPSHEKDNPLKKAVYLTDTISLKHWQNILTIEFAALDFAKPEKNQYAYQLEGFDPDWVFCGTSNSATYTNLDPGTYVFKAKGSNNDGLWNETPKTLVLHVFPPPWKTWWAYGFYLLAIAGLIFLFIKNRVRKRVQKVEEQARIEKARFEERELLRKQNAADFHDELGHRLTKISLFLELADRTSKTTDPVKQYLTKIKTNASGLSDGIRDLIWSLDPKKDSMYQTMLRLQEFGDRLFDFSKVRFKTIGINESLEQITLEPDVRRHVLLIFKESMNNCLKYADCENAVLKIETDQQHGKISFIDDGKGFDQNQISKGYGLNNLNARAEKINADLSIKSEIGHGTAITLIFKIPRMG